MCFFRKGKERARSEKTPLYGYLPLSSTSTTTFTISKTTLHLLLLLLRKQELGTNAIRNVNPSDLSSYYGVSDQLQGSSYL
jgi:hypothetical protein